MRSRGIAIALATGRPYFGAQKIIAELAIRHPSVFFSGALIIEPRSGAVVLEKGVPPEIALEVYSRLADSRLYFEWYTRDEYFTEANRRYAEVHAHYLGRRPRHEKFSSVDRSTPILKFVAVLSDEYERREFADLLAGLDVTVTVGTGASHPGISFANVTSTSASRAVAFDELIRSNGVSAAEVLAFGDAAADLEFLRRARFGVAMGNAPREVQEGAKFVTRSVAADGVAYAIERLFAAIPQSSVKFSPWTPDQLYSFLSEHKISYQRIDHEAVFDCAAAEVVMAGIPGAGAKNLFLRDEKKRNYYLVVVPHAKRVDLRALGRAIGSDNVSGGRLSFGSPEDLMNMLGVSPGSVTLLAAVNDRDRVVQLLIDEELWKEDSIQLHPLVNTSSLVLSRDSIERFLAAIDRPCRVIPVPARIDR